jgi:oligopeptidase B
MRIPRTYCALTLLVVSSSLAAQTPQPPTAKQNEHISLWHSEKVNDPFYWLREKSNPDVIKYLEAENAYTAVMTKQLQPLADALYKEMLGRIKQTDLSVPTRRGTYYYYSRTEEGKQYPIQCRKKASDDGSFEERSAEEILLDLNELAKGFKFISLGAFTVSDDANLLAYATDTTGFRQFRLQVKDLRTGAILPDSDERVTSVEWSSDNRTLFYTTEDPVTKRSNILWRHVLGDETEPVYQEKDKLYTIHIGRSKDRKMLFLQSASTDTWETRFLPSDQPLSSFQVILPREKGHKYDVHHRDGLFYIRTNRGAKNFRLVTAPVSNPSPDNWKELIPHREDVLLNGLELFQDYAVASEKSSALQHFRILDMRSSEWHEMSFPESVYAAFLMLTPEYSSRTFRFVYQSLVTPNSVYDYDMAAHKQTLLKRQEVLGGYDPNRYVTERQWAVARDGVKIPLSIVYRRGLKKDGSAPLFLYGYGSYGFATPAGFDSNRLCLLDRDMAFAIAHIRGGDEMGESWHDDGMLMKKKNTFFDFIDSAEWLIANHWTSKDRLVIEGRSAGGLLMGAVTNFRPDLFRAVHAGVPFVDVMNTHDGYKPAPDRRRIPGMGQPK